MKRDYHRWYSAALNRDMEMLVFGHAGARMLVFPTSKGRFFEWEDRGMLAAIAQHLEDGWVQAFCVDSVDEESWYCGGVHPAQRAQRHGQYDMYLLNEVLPFTRQENPDPFMILTGASFGAYHAINFGLKHPEAVGRILAMSGLYDVRRFTEGHTDDNVYFNNPMQFIANEYEDQRLEQLRCLDIILVGGSTDRLTESARQLSDLLWSKGIGNALRVWEGWQHDWLYWQAMLQHYIGGHD
jgi:esterase/lipase superfamily enzyme